MPVPRMGQQWTPCVLSLCAGLAITTTRPSVWLCACLLFNTARQQYTSGQPGPTQLTSLPSNIPASSTLPPLTLTVCPRGFCEERHANQPKYCQGGDGQVESVCLQHHLQRHTGHKEQECTQPVRLAHAWHWPRAVRLSLTAGSPTPHGPMQRVSAPPLDHVFNCLHCLVWRGTPPSWQFVSKLCSERQYLR